MSTVVTETDLRLPDGRGLRVHDTGPVGSDELVVVWHHGTPNVGAPPTPLFELSRQLGVRWVSADRPGYGGSTALPDRAVGSVAADLGHVVDALGVQRFAVMGHSGGGPHALACAALLADRVTAVASVSGLAPYGAEGLDWFAGMAPSSEASLRAALAGRAAKEAYEASPPDHPIGFVAADWAALDDDWSWFGTVVGPAVRAGPAPLVDDDLAYVRPWGFDPRDVVAPALFVHGTLDRVVPSSHSAWLAARCPGAELRTAPDEGHVSAMRAAPDALRWLRDRA